MGQGNIREYATIRALLEHLYTYGMYSREEFARIGIGKNNYDKLLQLLRQVVPEGALEAHLEGGRKILRLARDPFANDSDTLTASFSLHGVKDALMVHMAVLLSLCWGHTPVEEREVGVAFELLQGNSEADKTATLRRQRRALIRFGYLVPAGRTGLALRTLPELSGEALERLYLYADFLSGTSAVRVAPILLRNTVRRALEARGLPVPGPVFLFRENLCRNLFDEELVYALLEACRSGQEVVLHLGEKTLRAAPSFLRFDARSGRWYLFALAGEEPVLLRLSRIQRVEPIAQSSVDAKGVRAAVEQRFAHCYLSSACGADGPVLVEAELHFQDAPGQRRQFEREMLLGQIIQRDGMEIYQALVNDPVELVPFLRSYGGYVRILPGPHQLDRLCGESWAAMLRNLEGNHGAVQ